MQEIKSVSKTEKDKLLKYFDYLVSWVKKEVERAGKKGVVVGVSGGIDSAVVACLSKKAFPDDSMGVSISLNNFSKKQNFVNEVASLSTIKIYNFSFTDSINDIRQKIDSMVSLKHNELAIANMKPRMRMLILYYIAQKFDYLVLGTDNEVELYIGYFTKYGDGGVDLLPLANLNKNEVRKMALSLGYSLEIINQNPSADLFSNQTDEKEIGLDYDSIDSYLRGDKKNLKPYQVNKIEDLHNNTEHKRKMPPVPSLKYKK